MHFRDLTTAFLMSLALLVTSSFAKGRGGDVAVSGHFKSNGTYVKQYFRSAPDGIASNNFSYKGNVNPYTGEIGTRDSDSSAGYSVEYAQNAANEGLDCQSQCARLWASDQLKSGITFDDCTATLCN